MEGISVEETKPLVINLIYSVKMCEVLQSSPTPAVTQSWGVKYRSATDNKNSINNNNIEHSLKENILLIALLVLNKESMSPVIVQGMFSE